MSVLKSHAYGPKKVLEETNQTRSASGHGGSNRVIPWLHAEVCCDGCRITPISGYRYTSLSRANFDLCSKCYRRESPESQMTFRRIDRTKAAPPFQIVYIGCYNCGTAPIHGPRYRDKLKDDCDLCEVCYTSITTSKDPRVPPMAPESDFEKIHETKLSSFRQKKHISPPAFHFDKKCDECSVSPVKGPCYVLIKNKNYALCALCHDHMVTTNAISQEDFRVCFRPDPRATIHLLILSCVGCGATPIEGPAYKHVQKENKALCLLCFLHIKEEKADDYTRVEPPPTESSPHFTRSYSTPLPRRSSTQGITQRTASLGPGDGHQPLYKPRNGARRPVPADPPNQDYGRGVPTKAPTYYNQPPSPAGNYGGPTHPPASNKQYQLSPSREQPRSAVPNAYQGAPTPSYPYPYSSQGAQASNFSPSYPFKRAYQRNNPAAAAEFDIQKYIMDQTALQLQNRVEALRNQMHHAKNQHTKDFYQKLIDNLQNYAGNIGGGGGGSGLDPSQSLGGAGGAGFDPSQFMGGGGGGFDPSQFMGGGGGGFDPSQFMGGGGAGFDPSQYMGVGGAGFDPSQFMGGGGAGFDPSQFMGGSGGVDMSSLMGGIDMSSLAGIGVDMLIPGAGAVASLIASMGSMALKGQHQNPRRP